MRIQLANLAELTNALFTKRIAITHSVLAIVILYNLLHLTVALLPSEAVNIEKNSVFINHTSIKPAPKIGALHLFGLYQMNTAALLPIAQLGLTLQGILYASQPALSQAIIASANGEAKAYKIGDSINGVVIKQILANDVIIESNDALQRLPLIRPSL